MQLKLAARFFYRSSRLISRGVSICFVYIFAVHLMQHKSFAGNDINILYAGECKGTNILCYLVNEMPACYHKYRKKEGTGVL